MNWLKDKDITAVVTTERGKDSITRHGLEEYIPDCVVTLDNRVDDQIATRRLRIVKYRGSAHGNDECPFIVNRNGLAVIPITSAGLAYTVSSERVSTGIPSLDAMLVGGVFRGSSILVTGTAGTGKSSIAAHLVDAACRRGAVSYTHLDVYKRQNLVRMQQGPDDGVGHEQAGQNQPRKNAGDEQLGDRDIGRHAINDHDDRRRDEQTERPGAGQRTDGNRVRVTTPLEFCLLYTSRCV